MCSEMIPRSKELLLVPALVLVLALCSVATELAGKQMKAFQMREDFGVDPLSDCYLQYYYSIPCPTYSWFWAMVGGDPGDTWGVFFEIGDMSTGTGSACDPEVCHSLETIRILDFSGYGTIYPGCCSVRFDIYCSDGLGCPVGLPIWTSSELDFHFGWNYIDVDPPLCLTPCSTIQEPVLSAPRILITATQTGYWGGYPFWGFDNIGKAVEEGCVMHDTGCLPALYPRPAVSNYDRVHSGYYGSGSPSEYCPSWGIVDFRDTTRDGSQFGYIEFAWRIYLSCTGPSETDPSTWGNIKSIYR